MEQLHYLNKTNKIKDTSKGHKIAGALYLITNHLSDNDPLKTALRTHAITMSTVQNKTNGDGSGPSAPSSWNMKALTAIT